jgi:PKD repeat protein
MEIKKQTLAILLTCFSLFANSQDGIRVYLEKPNLLQCTAGIVFSENTTDGVDFGYDSPLFGSVINSIYTYNGNTAYVNNWFGPLTDDRVVQLGMTLSPDTGLFIIGIDFWYGDTIRTQLIDNLVPGLHDFPYVCQAPVSNDRFKIIFEYPMCVEVYSGCERGLIVIDNDDEGSEYILEYENDTVSYPSNTDTIRNLDEGTYTLISGIGETYTFGIQTTLFDASLYVSESNVWVVDSWVEFVLTCFEPLTQIRWDFGDGSTYTGGFNPVHLYSEPGIYSASVTLTAFNGCQKTINQLITVSDFTGIQTIEKTRIVKTENGKWAIDGKQIE